MSSPDASVAANVAAWTRRHDEFTGPVEAPGEAVPLPDASFYLAIS